MPRIPTLSLLLAMIGSVSVLAQEAAKPGPYAGPVISEYRLPDPLAMVNGARVATVKDWPARRAEILRLFESEMYGKGPAPGRIHGESWDEEGPFDIGNLEFLQVTVHFRAPAPDGRVADVERRLPVQLLMVRPKDATRPPPVFLGLNFAGNHSIHPDPRIKRSDAWMRGARGKGIVNHRATKQSRGVSAFRWPLAKIIGRGYAVATAYYGDTDPDFDDGFQNGAHGLYLHGERSKPAADAWGSIAAWAWGLRSILSYLERGTTFFSEDSAPPVPIVDARRVIVFGHSRLGKTALWAGALDERFAAAISNDSGCGGAALSRRRHGETVAKINERFPHWFCDNFNMYNDNEDALPVDQHLLIALMAPRPALVSSAAEDDWADPRGEFLAARYADPVYRLLADGKHGIESAEMPQPGTLYNSRIAYHIRPGGHDVTERDWDTFLDFADKHVK